MVEKILICMDLVEVVYFEVGLLCNDSVDLVESVFGYIFDVLVDGEIVKISLFGIFLVCQKVVCVGCNFKIG